MTTKRPSSRVAVSACEPAMPSTYVCAACGGTFPYGDEDRALSEASRNGFKPEDCVPVCASCFAIAVDLSDGAIVVGPTIN